jgi:hypothetical protein
MCDQLFGIDPRLYKKESPAKGLVVALVEIRNSLGSGNSHMAESA